MYCNTCINKHNASIYEKYFEKTEDLTKGQLAEAAVISVGIGMEMGLFNVYNLDIIMKKHIKQM